MGLGQGLQKAFRQKSQPRRGPGPEWAGPVGTQRLGQPCGGSPRDAPRRLPPDFRTQEELPSHGPLAAFRSHWYIRRSSCPCMKCLGLCETFQMPGAELLLRARPEAKGGSDMVSPVSGSSSGCRQRLLPLPESGRAVGDTGADGFVLSPDVPGLCSASTFHEPS